MALRIFDVDTESKPKTTDDVVGRFRSGTQLNGRPMALSEWRVTSADPLVLNELQTLMGGAEPQKWDTNSDEKHELLTTSTVVDIILDGPGSVRTSMVLWGRNGKIRECDGASQKGSNDGADCVCPSKLSERKDAAKAGHGCEPSIQVYFRLAEAPELGKFKFFSGSWTMAAEIGNAEQELSAIDGPALATLELVNVSFKTKDGKQVSYTKPVLTITGPAPEVQS
jgi:hypothetical protein